MVCVYTLQVYNSLASIGLSLSFSEKLVGIYKNQADDDDRCLNVRLVTPQEQRGRTAE